jgi:hypothetical protein
MRCRRRQVVVPDDLACCDNFTIADLELRRGPRSLFYIPKIRDLEVVGLAPRHIANLSRLVLNARRHAVVEFK